MSYEVRLRETDGGGELLTVTLYDEAVVDKIRAAPGLTIEVIRVTEHRELIGETLVARAMRAVERPGP